jgi:Tfp pilus assembly protein PilZ
VTARPGAKRRYRRMTVRLTAVYEYGGKPHEAVATTLGAGGMFVATDDPPPQGAVLKVRFQVPGGTRSYDLIARVVWTHAPSDGPSQSCGMGLAFASPAECAVLATELEALAARAEAVQSGEGATGPREL